MGPRRLASADSTAGGLQMDTDLSSLLLQHLPLRFLFIHFDLVVGIGKFVQKDILDVLWLVSV